MTLIATLVAENVLVQVSDRRISFLHPDGKISLRDDLTNKAVIFENRATLAFTGFAELEGKATDLWIAERLAREATLNDGFERITADLTELFRRRPYRGNLHAIVIAGWKRNGHADPTGFSGLISNFFETGVGWKRSASSKFDWFVQPAHPDRPTLIFAPDYVSRSNQVALYRLLLRTASRGLHVSNAVRLMASEIQSAANLHKTIGKELMVSVLSRSAVPVGNVNQLTILNRQTAVDVADVRQHLRKRRRSRIWPYYRDGRNGDFRPADQETLTRLTHCD
jgi:hypothetical protein